MGKYLLQWKHVHNVPLFSERQGLKRFYRLSGTAYRFRVTRGEKMGESARVSLEPEERCCNCGKKVAPEDKEWCDACWWLVMCATAAQGGMYDALSKEERERER